MKRLLIALSTCILATFQSQAQINKVEDIKKQLQTTNIDTVAWVHAGFLNIGMNEGFLHNWAAGGEVASFAVNGIFNGRLDWLNHRDIWSNNLDLSYGLTYNYSTSFIPRKTDDRIDFTSKYGHSIDSSKYLFFTTLFNFKSQFTKGYDYALPKWDSNPVSKFFSPAYFTVALGVEYRKGSDISFFLSPIAGRLTLVDKFYTSKSAEGAYGVPYNKNAFAQFGAYFSGRYVYNINKNMMYRTRLDLYSNYLAKDTKDSLGNVVKTDNPGNISVLFDNLLAWKISKYVTLSLGATFMYDHNVPYSKTYIDKMGAVVPKNEPGEDLGWLQVKQTFTLGVAYKF
jgi:hypothetical protein